MNLEQVKQFIEENKENEEVKSYIQGLDLISVERIDQFLQTDKEAKSWFDRTVDKRTSKSLETWKANHLEGLLDSEIRKRFPQKDEKELEVEKLRAEVENMKQEKLHERLRSHAIKLASEKNLPLPLVDFFIGSDEAATITNLDALEQSFQSAVQQKVEQRIKGTGYTPPNETTHNSISLDAVKGMSQEEINKNWDQIKQVLQKK